MQLFARKLVVIAGFLIPVLAHAQATKPLTRAQVHAHLVQLERAGYHPFSNDRLYPDELKRAEANLAQKDALKSAGYGPDLNGTVQSGGR